MRQTSHPRQLHTDDWEHKQELALGLVCPCVLECAMAAAACLRTRLENTAVLGIDRYGVGANKIIGASNLFLELEHKNGGASNALLKENRENYASSEKHSLHE
jgi:hypothetical protein